MDGSDTLVRHDLDKALRTRRHVRLLRSARFADDMEGFVVGVGRTWVLVALTELGGHHGGWAATRIKHVDRVHRIRSFQEDFARSQAAWPPAPPGVVDLDRTADLLTSMQAHAGVIGIEQEDRLAQTQWIGRVDEVASGRLWLHEVDPRARWHDDVAGYRLRNITSVTIATPYMRALEDVLRQAGRSEPPAT